MHIPENRIDDNEEIALSTRLAYAYFYQAELYSAFSEEGTTYHYYAMKYVSNVFQHGKGFAHTSEDVWKLYDTGYWDDNSLVVR